MTWTGFAEKKSGHLAFGFVTKKKIKKEKVQIESISTLNINWMKKKIICWFSQTKD